MHSNDERRQNEEHQEVMATFAQQAKEWETLHGTDDKK